MTAASDEGPAEAGADQPRQSLDHDQATSDGAMDKVRAIDTLVTHVWMVRNFLKHADESEDDEDLRSVARDLYDFILAVGPLGEVEDPKVYLKMAKKKLSRLRRATELYEEIQPEVSGHTNFVMAARSLRIAVDQIEAVVKAP